jgi:hypothetical protein
MTDGDAIRILKEKLNYIATLKNLRYDSHEFEQWQRDTSITLKKIFAGDEGSHAKEFDGISYSCGGTYPGMPDSVYQKAYLSGLGSAEAKLNSMIKEIKNWGLGQVSASDSCGPSYKPASPNSVKTDKNKERTTEKGEWKFRVILGVIAAFTTILTFLFGNNVCSRLEPKPTNNNPDTHQIEPPKTEAKTSGDSSPSIVAIRAKAERGDAEHQLTVLSENTPPSIFAGEWANKDFKTGDITRINIHLEGSRIVVHMWGRCHPKECDWGEATATVKGQVLSLTWNQGFSVNTQELELLASGSLQLTGHCHFTDGSGRNDYDYKDTFAKGLVHNWNYPSPTQ